MHTACWLAAYIFHFQVGNLSSIGGKKKRLMRGAFAEPAIGSVVLLEIQALLYRISHALVPIVARNRLAEAVFNFCLGLRE